MKRNLIAISILASFLLVVIHDIIPHHHHDAYGIEFNSHDHDSENQDGDSGTDNDHHFPIPAHNHILAAESFDVGRTGSSFETKTNFSCCNINSNNLLCIHKSEPPGTTLYLSLSIPVSSFPFIISPNAMRGSPVMA